MRLGGRLTIDDVFELVGKGCSFFPPPGSILVLPKRHDPRSPCGVCVSVGLKTGECEVPANAICVLETACWRFTVLEFEVSVMPDVYWYEGRLSKIGNRYEGYYRHSPEEWMSAWYEALALCQRYGLSLCPAIMPELQLESANKVVEGPAKRVPIMREIGTNSVGKMMSKCVPRRFRELGARVDVNLPGQERPAQRPQRGGERERAPDAARGERGDRRRRDGDARPDSRRPAVREGEPETKRAE